MREFCHLGRCAAFGFTLPELRAAQRRGYAASVDELLEAQPETLGEPPTTVLPPGFTLGALQIASLILWWLQRMVSTRAPLHEKMVLFWHGYFTTSAEVVPSGSFLLDQHRLLRAHAVGPFADLLREMARDPAMLVYLDGQSNHKEHPNENFARELLELFTLGVGHYSEKDVKEAARALTGWDVNWLLGRSQFHSDRHDDGPKRVLGQVVESGEELLSMLAARVETARHLSRRLFRYLAGVDPSGAEVERLAGVFRARHGHVKPLLRALLLGAEFRSLCERRDVVRCPIEWVVWVLRSTQLGVRWRDFERIKELGQLPFLPPSVRGWPEGALWMNSSSLADRFRFAAWAAQRSQVDSLVLPDAGPALQRELAGLSREDALCLTLCSPEAQLR